MSSNDINSTLNSILESLRNMPDQEAILSDLFEEECMDQLNQNVILTEIEEYKNALNRTIDASIGFVETLENHQMKQLINRDNIKPTF